MADKMMRIAGRGNDGKPKALKTNNLGNLEVRNSSTRKIFSEFDLLVGTSINSEILNSEGYSFAKLNLIVTNNRKIRVTKKEYRYRSADETYIEMSSRVIYESDGSTSVHSIEHYLHSKHYSITVENIDSLGGRLTEDNSEILLDNIQEIQKVDVIDKSKIKKLLTNQYHDFNAGTSYETDIFPTNGDVYARAIISLSTGRKIKVSIQHYYYHESTQQYRGDGYQEIYSTEKSLMLHSLDYFLKSDYYSLKIENVDTLGTSITTASEEIRLKHTTPFKQEVTNKKMENDLNIIASKIDLLVHKDSYKSPSNYLVFEKSSIKATVIAKGEDNYFYTVDSSDTFKKYKDIKTEAEPLENGITWNIESYGKIINFIAFQSGIVVFTEFNNQARIYHMNNISDNPDIVYESNTTNRSFFSGKNGFGIKSYYNGIGEYVLAGVYGRDQGKRDLLLSTDGGRSFEIIKQTASKHEEWNSHWHDVAFDVYHGFLWAAEGDEMDENQGVYFSDDFGESWRDLPPTSGNQPTAIIPFSDRVVFGRDSKRPGLDYYVKPTLETDYTFFGDEIKPLKEFKVSTSAFRYYAHSPIHKGNEAYLTFSLYNEQNPQMVMGTGDGGKTWHTLFMSSNEVSKKITSLFAIDDEYIYCYGNPTENEIVFARKPEWI